MVSSAMASARQEKGQVVPAGQGAAYEDSTGDRLPCALRPLLPGQTVKVKLYSIASPVLPQGIG